MLESVTPAVVNISTRGPMREANPLMDDPLFRRFFGMPDVGSDPVPQSLGSGVVVDADRGLVVTNSHVIANAAEITITLSDGRELEAELVGSDPQADIAVIQVEATGLTELQWADSEELRVGDFCVAIGNPFGLGQTVTSGIVSALGRSGLGIEDFEDFIQTDASINPGNSGGALVNLNGELIGINTAIVGPSGGNVGIGFAIPSNMALDLVEQLVEYGVVRRGALGITAQELTPRLATAFGVDTRYGVVIQQIRQESPADKAGLQVGDVIVAVDGRRVRNIAEVKNRIGLVRLGQRLRLSIIREGKSREIEATVEELQYINPLLDGVEFVEKTDRSGRGYVEIDSVAPGSDVDRVGLQPGDIVLSVNQQIVETVEELEAMAEFRSDEILLLVQRGQATQYIHLR
ncbi:MAG: DegQ family serine endoprotease [Gammaproteobacteria bacterium]|nr:DegQ family serine endoprotease [Gammaproteobacteria bacterium]